jgi:hypothetical protein
VKLDNGHIGKNPPKHPHRDFFTSGHPQKENIQKSEETRGIITPKSDADWNNKVDITAAEVVGPHIKILSITGIMAPHQQAPKEKGTSILGAKQLEDLRATGREDTKISEVSQLKERDWEEINTVELYKDTRDHKPGNVETEQRKAENKTIIFAQHINQYETSEQRRPESSFSVMVAQNISANNHGKGLAVTENKMKVYTSEVAKPKYVSPNLTDPKINKNQAVKVIEASGLKAESKSDKGVKTIFATENKMAEKNQSSHGYVTEVPPISVVKNEVPNITVSHGTSSHHGTDPDWAWLNVPWFTEEAKLFENNIGDSHDSFNGDSLPLSENLYTISELLTSR